MFDPGPCVYMEKLAGAADIADLLDLDRPLDGDARAGRRSARAGRHRRRRWSSCSTATRHEEADASEIREAGARVRLHPDGDVSRAALLAVTDNSPVDLLWGIGGTPEGVISAAAIKCIGGELVGRLWPRNDEERTARSRPATTSTRQLTGDDARQGRRRASSPRPASRTATCSRASASAAAGGATTESLVMRSRSRHRAPRACPPRRARSCANDRRAAADRWRSRSATAGRRRPATRSGPRRDSREVESHERAQEAVASRSRGCATACSRRPSCAIPEAIDG